MFDNDKTVIISAKDRTIRFQKGVIHLDTTQHEAPKGSEKDLSISLPHERYEFLGVLGSGGMGHVLRVRDLILNRSIAMKVLHTHHLPNPGERARFLEEAQIEAQLQHPGIVSVHEMGTLPSGHMFFTMREVRGVSLKSHIAHRTDPTENRMMLVQSLLRVCETVGYAHNRGVVHCDIKPSNIMIGSYGEVWLVDWGIARLIHVKQVEEDPVYLIHNEHSFTDDITGTPLYMSPEQANGFNSELQPTSDIYALGIILYQILLGTYPYPKVSINTLLEKVQHGELIPFPADKNEHELPSALVKICKKALSFAPQKRFQDGQEFANALQGWMDGSQKEELAFQLIQEGLAHEKESKFLLGNLEKEYLLIQKHHEALPLYTPEETLRSLWNREDVLNQKRKEGAKKWRQAEQLLLSAINHCPDHPKTNLALALFYFRAHQNPVHAHDQERILEALEKHTRALPEHYREKSTLRDYIVGNGSLSLHTTPVGATVEIEEYVEENRRMVPVYRNTLGTTPLHKVPLPMGAYRIRIKKEGYEDVFYPIEITRLKHWDGIPPNAHEPHPIWLPPKGSILANECYIPAGYFQYGGDNTIKDQKTEVLWLDGYIIGKYPFTNRQYIALLDQAYDTGIADVEVIQPTIPVQDGTISNCYGRDDQGHFIIQEDLDGDLWDIDWPVICLSYDKKCRAIDIYAQQTQRPYSLPSEEQWEKAARGVDGRIFPWGNTFFGTWSHCSTAKEFVHGPAPVGSYPLDCSPYEAYDMAGNVREATVVVTDDTYITKGGCWHSSGTYNRSNKRISHKKERQLGNLGFRIVRPIPEKPVL